MSLCAVEDWIASLYLSTASSYWEDEINNEINNSKSSMENTLFKLTISYGSSEVIAMINGSDELPNSPSPVQCCMKQSWMTVPVDMMHFKYSRASTNKSTLGGWVLHCLRWHKKGVGISFKIVTVPSKFGESCTFDYLHFMTGIQSTKQHC